VTFLGGSEQDEVSHESYKNDPYVLKYLALPFAVVATPFKAAYDAARGDPKPGPAVPRPNPQTSRLPTPTSPQSPNYDIGQAQPVSPAPPVRYRTRSPQRPMDYESIQLEKMAREIEQQRAMQSSGNGYGNRSVNRGTSSTASPILSFADELADLQRLAPAPSGTAVRPPAPAVNLQYASLQPHPPSPRASAPVRTSRAVVESPFANSALTTASGIVDRNGDGRIDHWLYRENGRLAREILDDDFDGRGERVIHYDIASNQVKRIDEDFNHDSAIDSWTDYRDGRVIRRRSDANHDGVVDSWTYYRDGEISRHERDTTGDGFRDHVGYYRNGMPDLEEQDLDGDGRAETTVRYDAQEEIIGREEDLNGDGGVDLISHFENGKLISRELLDPSALEVAPHN